MDDWVQHGDHWYFSCKRQQIVPSCHWFLKETDSSYPAITSLDLRIKDDITISRLTTTLFWWSCEIFFPCKSLHIRENMFASALGQNFTGCREWAHSVPSTCWMLMQSFPFFVDGISQSFFESTSSCWLHQIDGYLCLCCDKTHQYLQSSSSLWTKKICLHQWYTSYLPQKAV